MSISVSAVRCLFLVIACAVCALASEAGDPHVLVVVNDSDSATVRVEGKLPEPVRAFSFPESRAGVGGLAKRISDLKTYGEKGAEVAHRRTPEGAVFADEPLTSYSYIVDLSPQADVTLGAHVSWIAEGKGILMLHDLLPSLGAEANWLKVRLEVPKGMTVVSNEKRLPEGLYTVDDPAEAVFLIAADVRRFRTNANDTRIDLAIEGEWQFSDSLALKMSEEIFRHYEGVFDATPAEKIQVLLVRAPDEAMRDRWRAETRGKTVVIVSSPSTYRNHGEQRFHEQLRHELLHLWIPNSLKLVGGYAWFYEGFVFYRALIAGVELEQITFRDVLGTLADTKRRSDLAGDWKALAEPEENQHSRSTFYTRGTLAAFAADAALIRGSNGKRDLDDVLRRVFQNGRRPGLTLSANDFLIREFFKWSELRPLVNSSIKGAAAPDWKRALEAAGLSESEIGQLTAVEEPRSSQKAILKRLGYNDGR